MTSERETYPSVLEVGLTDELGDMLMRMTADWSQELPPQNDPSLLVTVTAMDFVRMLIFAEAQRRGMADPCEEFVTCTALRL